MARRTSSVSESNRYDDYNRNTQFFNSRGWWFFYLMVLIGANTCIVGFFKSLNMSISAYGLTITNIIHAFITMYSMHWTKGAPFWAPDDQGRYDKLTVWEQIDYGVQHTATKKILTAIPVILCIASCVEAKWTTASMFINIIVCLVCVIAKLPMMHRYRILGINED